MILRKIIAGCLVLSMLTLSVGCSQKKNIDIHNTNADRDVTVIMESEDEDTEDATDYSMGWEDWVVIGVIFKLIAIAIIINEVPNPSTIGDMKDDNAPK